MTARHPQTPIRKPGTNLLRAAGALLILGLGGLGTYFVQVQDATASNGSQPATKANTTVASKATGKVGTAVETAAATYLAGSLELTLDGQTMVLARQELGLSINPEAVQKEVARLEDSPKALEGLDYEGSNDAPVQVDRVAVEKALLAIKADLDRAPVNARMDMEGRTIHPAQGGFGVDSFGSISAIEVALRSGAATVKLEGVNIPPAVTIEDLGISDISAVLGEFTTKFSVAEKTRNANLKLLASKVDGSILAPGQEFSFNEVTGMRTLEDGFKMAHVIQAGEMVDGMAGGSCQISTTLHGAAFFGGLDILKSTPHSRPSTYVTLGLDATVVAGKVDLRIRNPFDFPVVIHYRVARGVSHVELLGKEKPFDKIEFERNIDRRIDFETVTREDPEMGMGHMVVDQLGYPGYKVSRVRRVYKDGKVIRTDKSKLAYRPVIEYARLGMNPNPNLPAPKKKKGHGPKPTSGRYSLTQ